MQKKNIQNLEIKFFQFIPEQSKTKGVNNSTSTALKFSYIGSLYQTRNLDNFLKHFQKFQKINKNTVLIYTAGLQMM